MHLKAGRKLLNVLTVMIVAVIAVVSTFTLPSASASEDYRSWRQMDPRWSSIQLGTQAYTSIGSIGCLVTSLSMLAVHTGLKSEKDFDPGKFAESLKSAGAFNQWGGLSNWNSVNKVIPEMSIVWQPDKYPYYWGTTDKAEKIKLLRSFMNDGYWPLVNVNTHHWVVIDRVTDDMVYMIDPASDSVDMFGYYGNITRTDKNDFDYILVKSSRKPSEIGSNDPVEYDPAISLTINRIPEKDVFGTGEIIDLSTGIVSVSIVDQYEGEKNYTDLKMDGSSELFNIYTEYHGIGSSKNVLYDPGVTSFDKAGPYTITLEAVNKSGMFSVSCFDIHVEGDEAGKKEYCNASGSEIDVVSSPDENGARINSIYPGGIVKICSEYEGYGKIVSSDFTGWVELDRMAVSADETEHLKGDINGDDRIDITDFSLLSEYLRKRSITGDGISLFNNAEYSAADMNSDCAINEKDMLSLLDSICK